MERLKSTIYTSHSVTPLNTRPESFIQGDAGEYIINKILKDDEYVFQALQFLTALQDSDEISEQRTKRTNGRGCWAHPLMQLSFGVKSPLPAGELA